MFIGNIEHDKSTVLLHKSIGKYLETHGIPLLGFKGDKYVFKNTPLLKTKLNTLPFGLKVKLMMTGGDKS